MNPTTNGHPVHREPMTPAQATSADSAAAVDVMALLGRCLGNIELVVRVLDRFRKTGCADLEQIERAVERSDYDAVVQIAHRFKGAAGNTSAPALHKIAAAMEQFGREQNGAELSTVLAQLRSEWENFIQYAEAFAPTACVTSSCLPGQLHAAANHSR